jgi:7-cyano-7-deazaguanine synthase
MNELNSQKERKNAVVLCSGGMDSVTLLNMVSKEIKPKNITVLFINYNQKTVKREREFSKISAERIGSKWIEFNLRDLRSITKTKLIHDFKEERDVGTEVQGRNTIFIGIGVALAQTLSYTNLYIGLQSADVVYGDAQPEYFKHMKRAMKIAYGIDLLAPLLDKTKSEIMKIALQLKIDLNLTYSCYYNENKPCGKCPSCIVRIKAEKTIM